MISGGLAVRVGIVWGGLGGWGAFLLGAWWGAFLGFGVRRRWGGGMGSEVLFCLGGEFVVMWMWGGACPGGGVVLKGC